MNRTVSWVIAIAAIGLIAVAIFGMSNRLPQPSDPITSTQH